MATGAAGDGLIRGVFEGCISGNDTGIQRRPYHRNCGCALHKSRGNCSHVSRCNNVSYPIRRSWSEGCLGLLVSSSAATRSSSSPSASPIASPRAAAAIGRKGSMVSIHELEEEGEEEEEEHQEKV